MPITDEMARILRTARRTEASDVNIVAGLPPALRIQGEIIFANTPPLSRDDTHRLAYELLTEEQRRVFERDWQICCSVYDDEHGRMRVAVYYHAGNPELAIRMCNTAVKTREQLSLPEVADTLTRMPTGLVLITGPTGSGKTTSLNYMIDLINSERRCKIITIEDPIEYIHPRKKAVIVQQEVHTDVRNFASALVHALRQNPDVICIGEMRDYDTTATALTAAETGHLVIATLHTPNSLQTMERVISLFPAEQQRQVIGQLANCLRGIIAQRLIPSADKTRRALACEVLIANTATRNHIRGHEFHKLVTVMETSTREGMLLLDQSLATLYERGEITYDAAVNNSSDPAHFKERYLSPRPAATP